MILINTLYLQIGVEIIFLVCRMLLGFCFIFSFFFAGSVGTSILTNATAKTAWIKQQLQIVKDNFLDGVNFDYEEAILQSQPELRDGYTNLVVETRIAFKNYNPSLMVKLLIQLHYFCPPFLYFFLSQPIYA